MAKNVCDIDITLVGGILRLRGGLYNLRDNTEAKEIELKQVCPVCKDSLLDQVYCCQKGCKPGEKAPAGRPEGWKTGELGTDRVQVVGRGKDAKLVLVDGAALVKAKEESCQFPKGQMDISVHPAEQVERTCAPGSATYCFIPQRPDELFALLLEKAADPTVALLGIINMRNTEKLYRLVAHNGTLRVAELLRPSETASYEAPAVPAVQDKHAATFNAVFEAAKEDFEPEGYANVRAGMLRSVIEAEGGATITSITSAIKKPEDDLEAQLQATLAALQAAKTAKSA